VGLTGPELGYTAGDLAFGTAYVGYLTWHSVGLTLLLDGTDRQAGGVAMTTLGLGTLTGMYLAPHVHLDAAKVLMLFAGNVWGTWIGGWSGAIVRDSDGDLSGARSTGLTLVSTVLGSDIGLAAVGLVAAGLVDMEPTRFAVINLSGLGGMMIGMLAAGFAQAEPLREGNVVGSLAGLALGTLVTSFIDFRHTTTWDELLAAAPSEPVELDRCEEPTLAARASDVAPRSATPIAVDQWFPTAQIEPGPDGEARYMLSVIGTWR
ncbi:hypothetical protein L6R52_40510, partial [Myxococcota bacterium]|nr:hypothetical protein [Myxococcota bacterium]